MGCKDIGEHGILSVWHRRFIVIHFHCRAFKPSFTALSKEVGPGSNQHVPLWQTTNDVAYCQQLPTVQDGGGGAAAITLS